MTESPKIADADELRSTTAHPIEPQIWLDPEDYPNVDHLVTEDDTPLDNQFVAKQADQRAERLIAQLRALGVDPQDQPAE